MKLGHPSLPLLVINSLVFMFAVGRVPVWNASASLWQTQSKAVYDVRDSEQCRMEERTIPEP